MVCGGGKGVTEKLTLHNFVLTHFMCYKLW